MVASARRQDRHGQDFVERTYRDFRSRARWVAFAVARRETDLYIRAESDLTEPALWAVDRARLAIEGYIERHPEFRTSLEPLPFDPQAPPIVQEMLLAAERGSAGPMPAVAGAIAESVEKSLRTLSRNVVVENGGDIFLSTEREITVGIFAGRSPQGDAVAIKKRRSSPAPSPPA